MLYVPGNDFSWSVDNFGSTYSDSALGTSVPGNASANVKGANTALLAGIAEDCYGISICFLGGNANGVIRRQLTDLLIDPGAGVGNAGSSWSVMIANLLSNSPTLGPAGNAGYWYYFPIFLKAGTAIGAAHQDLAAATVALRMAVRVYGKPSRPDMLKVGTKVQTLGAVTASTQGTAFTPGTGALGAVSAALGTLTYDSWWFQLGIASNTTTMAANSYWCEILQTTTTVTNVLAGIPYGVGGSSEQAWKGAFGLKPPQKLCPAGAQPCVQGAAVAAPDAGMTAIIYAVSG